MTLLLVVEKIGWLVWRLRVAQQAVSTAPGQRTVSSEMMSCNGVNCAFGAFRRDYQGALVIIVRAAEATVQNPGHGVCPRHNIEQW